MLNLKDPGIYFYLNFKQHKFLLIVLKINKWEIHLLSRNSYYLEQNTTHAVGVPCTTMFV